MDVFVVSGLLLFVKWLTHLQHDIEILQQTSSAHDDIKTIVVEELKKQQQQSLSEAKRMQMQAVWMSMPPLKLEFLSSLNPEARWFHVINLDRRPDRWLRVSKQFQLAGFNVARMPAVDAKTFPHDLRMEPSNENEKNRKSNFNCIGCSFSHAKLLEHLANSTADQNAVFLVAEDDAGIVDVAQTHELIHAFANQNVCNLMNLGFGVAWTPKRHEEVAPGLWRATGRSILTHAYAIKQSVMKSVANAMKQGALQLALGKDRRQFACDVVWTFATGVVHCIPKSPVVLQIGKDSDIES